MEIATFIVDDVDDMRRLIRIIIEANEGGVEVIGEAASGEEALVCLEHCEPDVVVLDQTMPGLSGLETAASIRARRPTQPIILFSAYLDDDVHTDAEAIGATVLSKVDFNRLPSTIRELARGVKTA